MGEEQERKARIYHEAAKELHVRAKSEPDHYKRLALLEVAEDFRRFSIEEVLIGMTSVNEIGEDGSLN